MIFPMAGFLFCVMTASAGLVYKYGGLTGIVLYVVGTSVTTMGSRTFFSKASISERRATLVFFALLACLAALFFFLYPIADSGAIGGGSDRDDGLNLATSRLLHGQFPYEKVAYLGNPISVFPGQIFFAVPWVLLGNSAYQNFFWLGALFFGWAYLFESKRKSLFAVLTLIVICPEILKEIVTGGDLFANSVYVALFSAVLLKVSGDPKRNAYWKFFLAALLGIGLSSRLNFLLIFPVLYSYLVRKNGFRQATLLCGVVVLAWAAVTLPVYFWDPSGFTPLHIQNVFKFLEKDFPRALVWAPGLCLAFSVLLSFFRVSETETGFLWSAAVTQWIPVGLLTLLPSLAEGEFFYPSALGYGLMSVFFASSGFFGRLWETADE